MASCPLHHWSSSSIWFLWKPVNTTVGNQLMPWETKPYSPQRSDSTWWLSGQRRRPPYIQCCFFQQVRAAKVMKAKTGSWQETHPTSMCCDNDRQFLTGRPGVTAMWTGWTCLTYPHSCWWWLGPLSQHEFCKRDCCLHVLPEIRAFQARSTWCISIP